MDKNTIIGLVVIAGVIILWGIFSQPGKEEIEALRLKNDSIALVRQQQDIERAKLEARSKIESDQLSGIDTLPIGTIAGDSARYNKLVDQFGPFADRVTGENKFYTLENKNLKLTISTLGGKIYSAELKNYKTYDSLPLVLFHGDSTIFGLSFFSNNRNINTNSLFFTSSTTSTSTVVQGSTASLSMRLNVGSDKYIEYLYTLEPESYMVGYKINLVNMSDVIKDNVSYMDLNWEIYVPPLEKGRLNENNYTQIFYKNLNDEVDEISASGDNTEKVTTPVQWVAFKQQFFSSILIADENFLNVNLVSNDLTNEGEHFLKKFHADISLPYNGEARESIPMKFYFGPNQYNLLSDYEMDFERIIPLGWGFFLMQWINRFAVIPVFNFLEKYIASYGIIILLLTILLKLVLFPLTYKSYVSSAKMRVLKPQVDEINAKIPKEKSMERQQATMALYKKAGASPLGGCLPMLVQFPILIAMFRFFPASIELRQKGFLWAEDLSTYDSIYDLPFEIPWYGDHISLFTILMTISTIFYTKTQQQMNPAGGSMPGMKFMMYMMPVMFLFFLNNYSSGLSYYYLVANLLTFAQMYLIRKFMVDDQEVLRKLETSKQKVAKKSGFQAKLEKMAKQRGYKMPKK